MKNNKIAWRGDSALSDGKGANLDLSKGMYDAGDHMKFGFPMAFSATVLSWAILEYGDQMASIKELDHAQESLKWITDYLVNAHPSKNVLYVQVSNPPTFHTRILNSMNCNIIWRLIFVICLLFKFLRHLHLIKLN